MMSAIAIVVASVLGMGPPPPPEPDVAPVEPTTLPTPIQPVTPTPIEPGSATAPGTPKRTGMPGAPPDSGTAVPSPVMPTPVLPPAVQPVVPRPVQPGSTTPGIGPALSDTPSATPPRKPAKRSLGSLDGPPIDAAPQAGGRCLDLGNRCRTMAIGGIVATALGGAALGTGIGLVAARPKPLLDEPSRLRTTRPAGGAVLAAGGALVATGIALLVSGVLKHRRDRGTQARRTPRGLAWTDR